ncbi:hypothetical protein HDU99_004922, partial [Rhizoclosmatium hyalinum]
MKNHPSLSKKIGNDLLVLLAQLGHKNLPKTVDEALSYLQTDERVAGIGEFQTLSLGDYEGKQITLYYRSLVDCFLEHMLEGGMEDMKFTSGLLKTEETGERVYGEYTSGDAFNAALKSAPPGAKVVTYSIYGDSTTLDRVGRISGHPIVIQYTNEPRSKSQTPKGRQLVALLSGLPKGMSTQTKAMPAVQDLGREIFHRSFEKILEPIKQYQRTGFLTALNYQMHHFILRLSVVPSDMLEQYAIGKIKGTKALSPCIICMSLPIDMMHCRGTGLGAYIPDYTLELIKEHAGHAAVIKKIDKRIQQIPRRKGLRLPCSKMSITNGTMLRSHERESILQIWLFAMIEILDD